MSGLPVTGVSEMVLEVVDLDAADAAVERLEQHGMEVNQTAFDGAGRAAYVDDPDGNVVELWTWDVAEHLA